MEIITVEKRDGKVKAKQLRKQGIVPCCVFGGHLPNSISIQMKEKIADQLLRKLRLGSKVQLKLEDETILTQIKESKRTFPDNKVEHIDFQVLDPNTKINSVIHVLLKNAENVQGILEHMQLEIPYASLPADMIDTITVDLKGKPTGTVYTIADIPELLSDRIELHLDTDTIVFRIHEHKGASSMKETDPEAV